MTLTAPADRVWRAERGSLSVLAPTLVIAIVAAFVAAGSPANTDVSWPLTLGERWLDGERPYVDFFDPNPPASILIYLPAVLLGRSLGIAPELAVDALVALAGVLAVGFAGWLMSRAGSTARREQAVVATVATVVLLLVPAGNFGEREHLAVIAVLPMLTAVGLRAQGRSVEPLAAALAGLGGGLAICIKPTFALALVGPGIFLLATQGWRRSLQALECYVAVGVSLAYALAVVLLLPAFFQETLGWVLTSYVPVRQPLGALLVEPITLLWLGLFAVLAVLGTTRRLTSGPIVLALASIGFEAVFFIQGKGWSYQALPAVLCLGLAVVVQGFGSARCAGLADRAALATAAVVLLLASLEFNIHPQMGTRLPGLAAAVARQGPHPTMLAIASDIAIGHPLVRDVGGRWVGSFCATWITQGLRKQEQTGLTSPALARLEAMSGREKEIVAADIRLRKPEVILVQDGWADYAQSTAALRDAMAAYQSTGSYGPVTLWVRRPET